MSAFENIIKNHWVQMVGLVFMAGSFYARFLLLEKEHEDKSALLQEKIETLEETLMRRISNTNNDIKSLDNRLRSVEKCNH